MKLLFFCKRRPQGKDLINRPYGRFFYLPKHLADKGHEVHILLFSYKNEPRLREDKKGITWTSVSLPRHGPFAYIHEAKRIIRQTKPDWLVGFSDTYYGIIAQRLGAGHDIPSLIDAYDNYESYIPWFKPLHYLWRRALSKASVVTAAGPALADLLAKSRPGKPTEIIPMAADQIFRPEDKIGCRNKLGLPLNKKFIGYSGSTLVKNRGLELLFEAFADLKHLVPDIELVLTGRKRRNVSLPSDANWLGYIPDEDMPAMLNSLDVLVVMNRPSAFGNYSYPVKLYEAMSCHIPVVAIGTKSTKWILRDFPEFISNPEDPLDLGAKILNALKMKSIDYGIEQGWDNETKLFENILSSN